VAAERLFAEKGYREVTTREIAEAAKVNLGLIQYYFGSKSGLFIAVVQRLMQQNPCLKAGLIIEECPECPVIGSKRLCEFIYAYLEYLLRHTSAAPPCRVLAREVECPSDPELHDTLVQVVADELTRPLQRSLVTVLKALKGACKEIDFERTACSILGQCSFYGSQRPFLERMWGVELATSPVFEEIGAHIARFSLKALGIGDDVADSAVHEVFGTKQAAHSKACAGGGRRKAPAHTR
jgi:AcrR family transcriptional regulator